MADNELDTVPNALQLAANAAQLLASAGTNVLMAYANGRRPVLIIDKPPSFVRGTMKRVNPNGPTTTLVLAASFNGCQVEWLHTVHTAGIVQAVGHG